ncbi:MAG TPA: HAD-IA family hydrolase [Candidatus Binataceae bacterium]|nr:HAD-IA family hydrolase [Candidatus Binataceae bacterium]
MTAKPYPALWLFDFDNTLARLEPVVNWPALRAEVRTILERAGAPRAITEQVPLRSLSMYDGYRAHLERLRPATSAAALAVLARISKLIEKYELAEVDRAKPLDGALELVRAIAAAKLRAGVVTSNSSVTVARWLTRNRVAGAIAFIVGRDSALALKPSPAMVKRALELASARARDTVVVGDSEADLRAARAAKVRFIGIAAEDAARDRLIAGAATAEIYSSPAALGIHLNLIRPRPIRANPRRKRAKELELEPLESSRRNR